MPNSVERGKSLTEAYQRRVEAAFALWSSTYVNGTQGAFAERVSSRAGRQFSANSVLGWLRGAIPRELESMEALARALGVPAGWLYFGEPSDDPMIAVLRLQRRALDLQEEPGHDRAQLARLRLELIEAHVRAQMEGPPHRAPEPDEFTEGPARAADEARPATPVQPSARPKTPAPPRTLPETKVDTKRSPSTKRKGA